MTTYFVCSGAGATAAPYDTWNKAAVSIPALMTGAAIAGGDIIYVHNTHAYNAGAAITWTLAESGTGLCRVICVDGGDAAFTTGGSGMGSTVGAQTTGAEETTGGNFAFTLTTSDRLLVHGITIRAGAGGNSANADINIFTAGSGGNIRFSACTIWTDSTNTGAVLTIGNTAVNNQYGEFINCSFRFGATGQTVAIATSRLEMYGCSINASGSSPTTLFSPSAARTSTWCAGCDWSLATNVLSVAGISGNFLYFNNCVIGTPTTGTFQALQNGKVEFQACAAVDGTNGANMLTYYYEDQYGVVQDDQTVYRTTGSGQGTQDDGTATSYSLKMTPSAAVSVMHPLYTPWVYRKIAATGSKTLTVVAADTEAAVLKDVELWLEVEYVGGAQVANSPHSQHEGTFPLQTSTIYQDITAAGSNLTDTAEAWTGITETGTYSLAKTVTIDEQGYVRWRVGLAKDTTNPVYVDTKLAVA